MKIIRGKIQSAKKVVIYGPEGIGKSTLASQFPDPIFIDTEGSTKDMDVARTEPPGSWPMLMEQVRYFIGHPGGLRTLVIDTADWAEQLCTSDVCARYQKTGIEDFGYGKGYVFLQEEFGRLLNLLTELVEGKGIHVALAAHARMRKFEQPDELGAYDRWEMKLSRQVAPMVKEWADMVLFANYKTFVINVDGQGVQKGKNKVQGGKRALGWRRQGRQAAHQQAMPLHKRPAARAGLPLMAGRQRLRALGARPRMHGQLAQPSRWMPGKSQRGRQGPRAASPTQGSQRSCGT